MSLPCGLDGVIYEKLRLRLFGQEIRAMGGQIPDICELVNSMINQFMGAAPNLIAILGLLECFMKVKSAMESVPEAILSLDPGSIVDALEEVADCFASNVIPRLPQNALIYAIYDLLKLVISVLDCIESRLIMFASLANTAEGLITDSEDVGSALLRKIGVCLDDDLNYAAEGLTEGPFGTVLIVFQILGVFMQILQDALGGEEALRASLGMDEDSYLPDFSNLFGDLSGKSVEYLIDKIQFTRTDILIPMYDEISKLPGIRG